VDLSHVPRSRAERLIAGGRAVLAAFSLLAIWLDPSEPSKYAHMAYTLLAAYLGYACLLGGLVWAAGVHSGYIALVTHVLDLSIFTLFIFLTEGPTSPFFVYFVFALLAAALRWQWRGVLWTALATLGAFIGLGVYAEHVLRDPEFELNRFIIRSVYLAVVAALLGYLSAHEQRRRDELARLAAWPRFAPERSPLQEAIRCAANIVGAPRVLMLWEDGEEPWRFQATLFHGEFACTRHPASTGPPPVIEQLADLDFLWTRAWRREPSAVVATAQGLERWQGLPLEPAFATEFAIEKAICVRLCGKSFEGWLFFLDKRGASVDDLMLAQVVARQMTADLEQVYTQQRLQQTAVTEERVRFARELHDGVLQSLSGLALQLGAVQRLLAIDPRAATARLHDVQELVAAEQRDLRFFVRQIKPLALAPTEVDSSIVPVLEELCSRIERQWGLRVELTAGQLPRGLPRTLAHAAYRIVQEALANAARHGRAKLVRVSMAARGEELRIVVADDGRGFDFHGRHDLRALALSHQGPVSLKQRVASLGGELVIDSSESGARLEIALPLRAASGEAASADLWITQAVTGHQSARAG
jgi:signal transduction histidine kinase